MDSSAEAQNITISTQKERRSVAKQIGAAADRIRLMSFEGQRLYDESWVNRRYDDIIRWSLRQTQHLSDIRRVVRRDKTPEASRQNTAINETEKTQGILGAGGPHEKNVYFRHNSVFLMGINHRNASRATSKDDKRSGITKSREDFDATLTLERSTNSLPDKFMLQPLVTSLVDNSLTLLADAQYPEYKVHKDKEGNRKLTLGELKTYDDSPAVRLVFYNKKEGNYNFVNISEDTYRKLEGGVFDKTRPFLLTDILNGDISKKDLAFLKESGLEVNNIDEWFDVEPAKVAIGVADSKIAHNHPLAKNHITDPRFGAIYLVQHARSDIESEREIVTKKGETRRITSTQLQPVAITDQFGHLQTTAMPVNSMLEKALTAVCFGDQSKSSATFLRINPWPYIIPIEDKYLKSMAPNLSADMISLNEQAFSNPGAKEVARLLNIRELRSTERTPPVFNTVASLNRKFHSLLAGRNHPFITGKNSLENTAYHIKAMAKNGTTSYLAVEPEDTGGVSNAMAIAVHGNGNNSTIGRIVETGKHEVVTREEVLIPELDLILKKDAVPNPNEIALSVKDSLVDFFAFQKIFRDELYAAKRGESTAGVLARATHIGEARSLLEAFSAEHIGNLMLQLQATKMLSSTGKESQEIAEFAETEFYSSISKTAHYSYGLSGNAERVRHKPDNPVAVLKLVDAYEDIDFLRGVRNEILGDGWEDRDPDSVMKKLDNNEKAAVLWLSGKIKEIIEKSPQRVQRIENYIEHDLFRNESKTNPWGFDPATFRDEAKKRAKERRVHFADIVVSDSEIYESVGAFEDGAKVNASVNNKFQRFADLITQNTVNYLQKHPKKSETFALRELYLTQAEVAITEDMVDAMVLAYTLNKFYLAEGIKSFYQHLEETSLLSVSGREETADFKLLRTKAVELETDFNNFENIAEIADYAFHSGIAPDTLTKFVSQEADVKVGSLYRFVRTWLEAYGGSFENYEKTEIARTLSRQSQINPAQAS